MGAGGVATTASIVRLVLVFSPGSFEDVTLKFVRFNLLGYAFRSPSHAALSLPYDLRLTIQTQRY